MITDKSQNIKRKNV